MSQLTFKDLQAAVAGDAVALRAKTTLQPAGGDGDKVFPPSYAVEQNAAHKYAVEERIVGNENTATTVLLDSVASQANRAEMALLAGYEQGSLSFPVPYIDFSEYGELTDYKKLTVLEAPHRIADALFRDSMLDGTLFRLSEIGRKITEATPRNATDLFRYSPTSLLFGMWDSTGPKGGSGSKFQRSYVSEIVGYDVEVGNKVGSRIDPLQIEKVASDDRLFNNADQSKVWTDKKEDAEVDKNGNPVYASRGSASGEAGQPSKINHGNIPPTIDAHAGGVTISKAIQTTLISFASLRQIRFRDVDRDAETAARTAIAALGIASIAYQHHMDFDLRSRCLLIPTHPPQLEMLVRDGSASKPVDLDKKIAEDILSKSAEHAKDAGIGWTTDEIRLTPAPKLIELIRRSRKVALTSQISG